MLNFIKDFFSSFDPKEDEYEMQDDTTLDYVGDTYGNVEDEEEAEEKSERVSFFKPTAKPKIIPREDVNAVRMQIVKPSALEDAEGIVYILREKQAAILNFEGVSKDIARRILDIVSGGVFALDGHVEKVSNSIFIAVPSNYRLQTATNRRTKKSNFNFN